MYVRYTGPGVSLRKVNVPPSVTGPSSAGPAASTWATRRAPPLGSTSFFSGAITRSWPTTAVTWSALTTGARAPGGWTLMTTRPVVVARPSQTVTVTFFLPGAAPESWYVSNP